MPKIFDKSQFETEFQGKKVSLYTLRSHAVEIAITNFGGILVQLLFKGKDLVLGYDSIQKYLDSSERYFGALVGPVCNRIAPPETIIDGKKVKFATDKPYLLHSDALLSYHVWDVVSHSESELVLHTELNGDLGFPGKTQYTATYSLHGSEFSVKISAKSDATTIINATFHPFFNFGTSTVLEHRMWINADSYTEVDENCVACKIAPVTGTPFDFREPKTIGQDINTDDLQISLGKGYDHNYCVNGAGFRKAASVEFDGVKMTISTNQKGIQCYSGNWLSGFHGKYDQIYTERMAICLEPESYPNACNVKEFGGIEIAKGEQYESVTQFVFE